MRSGAPAATAMVAPLAAALVGAAAFLVARDPGAIGWSEHFYKLSLLPIGSKFFAARALPIGVACALAIAIVFRGRSGAWLRRGLGALGLGAAACTLIVALIQKRHGGTWSGISDGVVLAIAGGLLLAFGRAVDEAPPARWAAVAIAAIAAISSWAYTARATRPLRTITRAELAGLRLDGYFESNNPFIESPAPSTPGEDPAVPALPMPMGNNPKMLCGGSWHPVRFPDRTRCLPLKPLVSLGPDDVEEVALEPAWVGATPGLMMVLTADASKRMESAIKRAVNFRLVLVAGGERLVTDAQVDYPVPGPRFYISGGAAGSSERALAALLGR